MPASFAFIVTTTGLAADITVPDCDGTDAEGGSVQILKPSGTWTIGSQWRSSVGYDVAANIEVPYSVAQCQGDPPDNVTLSLDPDQASIHWNSTESTRITKIAEMPHEGVQVVDVYDEEGKALVRGYDCYTSGRDSGFPCSKVTR
jgi:hypothetical protein